MHKNPNILNSFESLKQSAKHAMSINLREKLANPDRTSSLSFEFSDLYFDYSKNLIDLNNFDELVHFAKEMDIQNAIKDLFFGEKINETEDRSVLHTELRNNKNSEVLEVLDQIKEFSDGIKNNKNKGFNGDVFTDVVNIGIGGSDLGPHMVCEALSFEDSSINVHFVSNIDAHQIEKTLKVLNPKTTLFIIASKTFSTIETMTNAKTAKNWFLESGSEKDVAKHFVAVSTNIDAVKKFGIDEENIFKFWDWVGGRFSLWSSVGLSIAITYGFETFKELLDGANEMDQHFHSESVEKNIPIIHALISFWNTSLLGFDTWAILPYDQRLSKLPSYLQQLIMESNGKSIDRNGLKVVFKTSPVVFGEAGTNGQHAFYQMIHQGTTIIPCDFITVAKSAHDKKNHQKLLHCNFLAQTQALAFGKNEDELKKDNIPSELMPYKKFEGNKPSTSIILKSLNAKNLGKLIAFYEHTVFTLGHLQNIYSFDQWGVELGKVLANDIEKSWNDTKNLDSSTSNLIEKIKEFNR